MNDVRKGDDEWGQAEMHSSGCGVDGASADHGIISVHSFPHVSVPLVYALISNALQADRADIKKNEEGNDTREAY